MYYEGLTKDKLEKVLDDVFTENTTRRFTAYSFCITNGMIDLVTSPLCKNNECKTCTQMRTALEEEIKRNGYDK